MGYHEVMQVCMKGHAITDRYNSCSELRKDFCNRCGTKTITKCLKCGEPIQGEFIVQGVTCLGFSIQVPNHCHKCGKPYPWAWRKKISKKTEQIKKFINWIIDKFKQSKTQ